MTFVRETADRAVTVWSVEAVPELAHAPATITMPNANAAVRMTISCGAGVHRAPRINESKLRRASVSVLPLGCHKDNPACVAGSPAGGRILCADVADLLDPARGHGGEAGDVHHFHVIEIEHHRPAPGARSHHGWSQVRDDLHRVLIGGRADLGLGDEGSTAAGCTSFRGRLGGTPRAASTTTDSGQSECKQQCFAHAPLLAPQRRSPWSVRFLPS